MNDYNVGKLNLDDTMKKTVLDILHAGNNRNFSLHQPYSTIYIYLLQDGTIDHETSNRMNSYTKEEQNLLISILTRAKARAKKLGLDFNLDESDIEIPKKCPLLDVPLDYSLSVKRRRYGGSIDRIDSTKGYVKGNVRIISDLANRMLQNSTKDEQTSFAKNLLKIHRLSL